MKRFVRLLLLTGLLAGLWVWLRELLEQQEMPVSADEASGASGDGLAPNRDEGPTKAQLYKQAQELGIKGRSKMTKGELVAAVAAAREGTPA